MSSSTHDRLRGGRFRLSQQRQHFADAFERGCGERIGSELAEAASWPMMNSRCPSRSSRGRTFSTAERAPPASTKSLRLTSEIGVPRHRSGDIILLMPCVLLGDPAGNVGADCTCGAVDRPRGEDVDQTFTPECRRAASAPSSGRDVTTSPAARSATPAAGRAPVNAARFGSRS
jgi:hypothetical protein